MTNHVSNLFMIITPHVGNFTYRAKQSKQNNRDNQLILTDSNNDANSVSVNLFLLSLSFLAVKSNLMIILFPCLSHHLLRFFLYRCLGCLCCICLFCFQTLDIIAKVYFSLLLYLQWQQSFYFTLFIMAKVCFYLVAGTQRGTVKQNIAARGAVLKCSISATGHMGSFRPKNVFDKDCCTLKWVRYT